MPLGILNAGSLITRTRQGYYLNYLDICSMWASMYPAGHKNAVWLISPSLLPHLFTMCAICLDSDGSDLSCGAHPVYIPGDGAAGKPYGTLLGRPVIVTEHCQARGVKGDIYLCDWSQYLIAGKSGRSGPDFAKSIHLKFDYDETAFRAVLRFDGQPWWSEPLTPKYPTGGSDNTDELSPFICLSSQ